HVESIDDVNLAIQGVRFPPRGKRGRCGTAGHNLYAPRPMIEELKTYNEDVALLLKVESEQAIRQLGELVAPDEVSGVMVGPSDLSLDMGIPGQTDHPRILKLIDHVRDVCRRRKIHYGTHLSGADQVADATKSGASWVTISDVDLLETA